MIILTTFYIEKIPIFQLFFLRKSIQSKNRYNHPPSLKDLLAFLSCGYRSVLVSYRSLQLRFLGSHSSRIDDPLSVTQTPQSPGTMDRMWSQGLTDTLKVSIGSRVLEKSQCTRYKWVFLIVIHKMFLFSLSAANFANMKYNVNL